MKRAEQDASVIRTVLPAWPAMMPIELAYQFCGFRSEDTFRAVAARHRIRPVDAGVRGSYWKRRDLEDLVERLPYVDSEPQAGASSAPPPGGEASTSGVDLAEAALDCVRSSSARGRGRR